MSIVSAGTVAGKTAARATPMVWIENANRYIAAGPAKPLREVWVAVRANLRAVLEHVTVADLARGSLPPSVKSVTAARDAWRPH